MNIFPKANTGVMPEEAERFLVRVVYEDYPKLYPPINYNDQDFWDFSEMYRNTNIVAYIITDELI